LHSSVIIEKKRVEQRTAYLWGRRMKGQNDFYFSSWGDRVVVRGYSQKDGI
jgi:hypothetical protein